MRPISFLSFWLTAFNLCSQPSDYVETVRVINHVSKSSSFIYTPKGSGTGTFIGVPYDSSSSHSAVFLITALHVLAKDLSKKEERVISYFDTVTVRLNLKVGGVEEKRYVLQKYNEDMDLALLRPIEKIRSFKEYDVNVFEVDHIADKDVILKGQSVYIAGFPLGIGSADANPVVQTGIVAYIDARSPYVLVDTHINQGNSGCPVYIIAMDGKVLLLGIIFKYQGNTDDLIYRKSADLMAPSNSGLGKVRLLHPFIESIKLMLKK